MSTQLKFIDLFCGIGSFHHSLKELGSECVMACDISQAARDTYQANYNIEPKHNVIDIDPKDIQKFDILCAGFPCQPWSNIGQHKGFDDERGTLFFQIMKFVSYHNPAIIILENVAALLTHNKGATYKRMNDMLEQHGYQVASKVLKCDDYGIPQMRKRLFVLAIRDDIVNNLSLDITTLLSFPKQSTPSLSEYLDKTFEKKSAYTIRCGGRNSPLHDKHNWDGYLVDKKEYRLTIEDCLRLQGFSSDFVLHGSRTQQYKLLGNTIPTNLTFLVGSKAVDILHRHKNATIQ